MIFLGEKVMMRKEKMIRKKPGKIRIRSRVILPEIVTPISSLKPVYVQAPTLRPIYPIRKYNQYNIESANHDSEKIQEEMKVELRTLPEMPMPKNLTHLKYRLITPRPHPMIQRTSPSPLKIVGDTRTTKSFYLYTPKPVTIALMDSDFKDLINPGPVTQVPILFYSNI